jgi:hypothetical protein
MRATVVLVSLFLLTALQPAFAFGSCRTPGYLQRFDARLPSPFPAECRELLRVNIETGRLRVPMRLIAYQATPTLEEAPAMAYLRQLAAKTGAAMDVLGDLDLARVTILLTDMPPATLSADGSSAAYALATGWNAADECTIAFYKQARPVSEEEFLIGVAHEIFHCVQGKTWRAKTALYPTGAWWVEGSAVYFSHLVVPDTAMLDFLASAFDASSPTRSIADMNYDASIFFLWLHEKVGPLTGVRRLIDAMPDYGGRPEQLAALSASVPLDRFQDFAQDYLDAKIKQPGGRRVPTSVRVTQTTTFAGPRTRSTFVDPFVVGREMLIFREGKSYDLKTVRGGDGRVRFQEGAGGAWSDPPMQVHACDEDKTFMVALVSTEARMDVDFIVAEAEELDRRACCLIGEWQPTADSLGAFVRETMEYGAPQIGAAGGTLACDFVGGDWTLWFGADGKAGVRWNNLQNRCVTSHPEGQMVQTMTRIGAHDFDWSLEDQRGGYWRTTASDVAWRYVMELGALRQERIMPEDIPVGTAGGFVFQCTADTLNIKGLLGLSANEVDHNRFGGPPR